MSKNNQIKVAPGDKVDILLPPDSKLKLPSKMFVSPETVVNFDLPANTKIKVTRYHREHVFHLSKKDSKAIKKSSSYKIVKKQEQLKKENSKKNVDQVKSNKRSKFTRKNLIKLKKAKDKLTKEDQRENDEKSVGFSKDTVLYSSQKIRKFTKNRVMNFKMEKKLKKEENSGNPEESTDLKNDKKEENKGDKLRRKKSESKLEVKQKKEKYVLQKVNPEPGKQSSPAGKEANFKKLQKEKIKVNLQTNSEKEKVNVEKVKIKKENYKQQEKEFHRWKKNSKIQMEQKTPFTQKKIDRKKQIQRNQNKQVNANVRERIFAFFKKDLKKDFIKDSIQSKLLAGAGSFLILILPIFLCVAIIASTLGMFNLGGVENESSISAVSKNLSPDVERWRALVEREARAQGMEKYVDVLLALIQVETGGRGTKDIMQSSESAGLPVNSWTTEEQSVRQGVKHLKNIVDLMKGYGKNYELNIKFVVQAYNFGSAFVSYVHRTGGNFSLEVSERYSRDVVAPSLGNHTGATYSYVNEVSIALGKTYLYWNGGNYMYHELVAQYLTIGAANISGEFRKVMDELEKYQGMPYVFGGKSPATGFDCSGLVSYGLAQIGINLPSYTVDQWNQTIPVSREEAQPGDLIFFKGTYGSPDFISHVGFYIDPKTMFDSNDSGVGYHDWTGSYWQNHFAGIRRVKR